MEIGKQFDDELIAAIDEANKFTVNQWRAVTSPINIVNACVIIGKCVADLRT